MRQKASAPPLEPDVRADFEIPPEYANIKVTEPDGTESSKKFFAYDRHAHYCSFKIFGLGSSFNG